CKGATSEQGVRIVIKYIEARSKRMQEPFRAVCEAEAELGAKATRRLRDLVRADHLDFEYVRCSCPEGTQGTPICNYGRECGTLRFNGRDVGAILIEEGLAVPFSCGATRCPKTPRPWCQPEHQ